ncbi:hypothetical protein Pyrfu_0504 [Pyrolobus fumarii 1A]|uniref:Uncharacterized protein n=1 Tax=Pyrolobus fumarii (strain DSM 11204 / 1A) TaxID=694429 RepID=G0EGK1_PYRF1|nr:hypothetical protein [Pyrolobus fumarii]AEM38375.1 hypothetical protein Pyrfu_0504 [Pyrolobus fumarii 1A]
MPGKIGVRRRGWVVAFKPRGQVSSSVNSEERKSCHASNGVIREASTIRL